ncbi:MAG: FHA domain-containing protein [Gammaproteobacteria bacterium]|nr:FHA domain-containing protein [Gammaproteobacteria bacterium]MDH3749041.1 FHA domain-containing protein [Gammaproteobacteria bacterium]
MGLLAAHINDAGISVLDSDKLLYREPGFALLDDDKLTTGAEAFSKARVKPRRIQNRFWSNLQTTPLADRRFQHLSAADLASRQLEQMWKRVAGAGDRIVLAVPAYMRADNLGLLLGIAAELKIPVTAMVDAAVAATRREYQNAVPAHVDLSLHSTVVTRLAQSGQAQMDRSAVIDECGMIALHEAWIALIAEAFVQQSRFDPLHTAETEQMLQDKLQGWLSAVAGGKTITLEIEYRGITHRADLELLEFVAAAAPTYHRIVSNLRALYRADETPALQLSDRAARMPGLADILTARVGGEIFLQEPGATARGLLSRCREMQHGDSSVSLIRQLPWDQSPVVLKNTEVIRQGGHPTHLLFDNTAYAIDTRPLTLGSQSSDGERCIELQQDMPGVSRRHCSLQQENSQCIVRDFSRYGTFLNGHRIDGSAVLQVGDLIRLGTPGYELRLITMENDNGS